MSGRMGGRRPIRGKQLVKANSGKPPPWWKTAPLRWPIAETLRTPHKGQGLCKIGGLESKPDCLVQGSNSWISPKIDKGRSK